MTGPAPRDGMPGPPPRSGRPAVRRYGPEAGEPPLAADPRRWGSLIGLVGGMVFIGSYSPVLGTVASTAAWSAGLAGAGAALFAHYVRPVPLGPLARPRPLALATYGACVLGEVVLIAAGSRALAAAGHGELRPALIAAVVGLHFLPFAWAFGERMFLHLGGAVTIIGSAGLLTGALGVAHAPDAAATAAGLTMIAFVTLHARGRFTRPQLERPAAQPRPRRRPRSDAVERRPLPGRPRRSGRR